MPGLARATPQLTLAETKVLLAVSMQGFRPRPTLPVTAQHTGDIPVRLIRHQNLLGRSASRKSPIARRATLRMPL
jgi:hypothetical protein